MMREKFTALRDLIGNTPMVQVRFRYKGKEMCIYAKVESYNFTGSIKDRMAFHVLQSAYEKGSLKKGDYIVEGTSGNTGIAFAALGAALGHPVVIYMPEWMSMERKLMLKGFGADLRLVTAEEGGFLGSVEKTLAFKDQHPDNCFLPEQFVNLDNAAAHYESTGPEILKNMQSLQLTPDAFIAGVGTGGTVMGVGRFLKEQLPNVKIYPLEPIEAPAMSQAVEGGLHRIEGIGDGFVPDLMDLSELDEVITVSDGDSICMAQKLAAAGLGVGISSGANFIGCIQALEMLGSDKIVTTVFADDNKKYLTTDLMKEVECREGYYSGGVEILSLHSLR
ncbi:MAG: PLP-dependent cysteine synthase family protein [Tissierellia bacterium]|nr:PLP-dependent cysteine synthase family protein [Tissierellia bacterium]